MRPGRTRFVDRAAAGTLLALAVTSFACGGGNGGATPAPTPTPTPTPSTGGTTITITAAGVSPQDLTVAVGSRVSFVNNDSRPHEMNSDPHPVHTQCPALNVGFIQPGQTLQSQSLTSAGTCTYHDHNQPSATSLQGAVRVQ